MLLGAGACEAGFREVDMGVQEVSSTLSQGSNLGTGSKE